MVNCSACDGKIQNNDALVCTSCLQKFHIACLNLTKEYYLQNKHHFDTTWQCPTCCNITRRRKNDDTPVRSRTSHTLNDTIMSTDDAIEHENSHSLNTNIPTPSMLHRSISLEAISKLFDTKLKENNDTIFTGLKSFIQTEINKAISKIYDENTKNTEKIQNQQLQHENEIMTINKKLQNLEKEQQKLSQDIQQLHKLMSATTQKFTTNHDGNSKKIVIHGLIEYPQETQDDLLNRVTNLFSEILNIDLYDYIDSIQRIGRRNSKRPLVIELLSKRMTNYILRNTSYFKQTGISVTEYLTEQCLKDRKIMHEQLRIARENGKYAIIKNNKLIVEGKVIGPPFEHQRSTEQQPETNSPQRLSTANTSQPHTLTDNKRDTRPFRNH